MVKLIKMTEEEISKLPYPEIARALGGILVGTCTLEDKLLKSLREVFLKQSESTEAYKTPIIEEENVKKTQSK